MPINRQSLDLDAKDRACRLVIFDVDATLVSLNDHLTEYKPEPQLGRILAAQASRTERLAIADDVIGNDGTVAELRQQVAALHEIYRSLA